MDIAVLALIVRAGHRPRASSEWIGPAAVTAFGFAAVGLWLACSILERPVVTPPPPAAPPPEAPAPPELAIDAALEAAPPESATPGMEETPPPSPPASTQPHIFMGTMIREHDGPMIYDNTDDDGGA